MLLPIGRDDAVVRRHAYVSYAIIALNVFVFIATGIGERSREEALQDKWRTAMRYLAVHPYLRVPTSLQPTIPPQIQTQLAPAPESELHAEEQAQLDAMAEEIDTGINDIPTFRWGYIPAHGSFVKIFTAMFMHAGFMHLLGNMLFFFVTGPFVEDVYGRPLFAFLYFAGGVVAAYAFALKYPTANVPLVGASGAIAAVMGAYLVRFAKSKLEFLLFIAFRPIRFMAPAFIVLPLWFLQQLWENSQDSGGSGVAFVSHIFGFVFGMGVAVLVKVLGIEEKYVSPVVERETTFTADPRIERAIEAKSRLNLPLAKSEILSLVNEQPKNVDALRVAIDVANEANDAAMLDHAGSRLLAIYVDTQQTDAAHELVHELWRSGRTIPRFLGRAAVFAERSGDRQWAISICERLCEVETRGSGAVGSLVKLGTLRRAHGDMAGARDAFVKARSHPDCSADAAPAIDAKLANLSGA